MWKWILAGLVHCILKVNIATWWQFSLCHVYMIKIIWVYCTALYCFLFFRCRRETIYGGIHLRQNSLRTMLLWRSVSVWKMGSNVTVCYKLHNLGRILGFHNLPWIISYCTGQECSQYRPFVTVSCDETTVYSYKIHHRNEKNRLILVNLQSLSILFAYSGNGSILTLHYPLLI